LIIKIIYIASGGAIGSVLRFLFSDFLKIYFPNLPIGTFFVNVLGSFLIGLFIGILNNKEISEVVIKYFFIIGLLGSFTTFSAFSLENLQLIEQSKFLISMIYIIFSVLFCIIAAYFGFNLLKF